MAKVNSNQVTFVDLTESRKLDVYINSNLPTTQIRNVNDKTYTPDWSVTNLILSADIFLDSKKLSAVDSLVWYEKIGTGAETQIGTNKSITISTNKMSSDTSSIITYICKVTYQNLESQSQVTFTRTDTGLNGSNGLDAPAVIAQYSADGLTNWVSTLNTTTHKYIRHSYDGGKTWSAAIKMVGEDGTSVRIVGTATSATQVSGTNYYTLVYSATSITSAELGDAYLYDGDLYVCADSRAGQDYFINVGNIQGPSGNDGVSSYVFIRYATDANGTNMSTSPSGKTYMGVYTSSTNVAPTTASSYTWSKFVGDSAKSIILNGDCQVFKTSKTGVMTPSTITVTAQTLNTSVTTWTYSTNGGQTFLSTAPTGVSINGNTVTVAGSSMTSNSIVIRASDGTYSDTYTIYKVADGSDGAQGSAGAPAPIAFLTNENITFSANAQGQITGTSLTSNIVAYNGTTKVLPTIGTIAGAPTGMTITSSTVSASNEIMLTITIANNTTLGSVSSNMGTISIPITSPVSTVLYLTWSKVNTGATGAQGATGNAGADAYTVLLTNESHVFPGDVSNATASTATTQVLAYKGSAAQTVTITSVNGVAASTSSTATGIAGLSFSCSALSGTNPTITFTATTDFKTANGTIPVVLTVGGITFTKQFSYSIAFKGNTGASGTQGAAGNPATAYWLVSSASAVQKTATGTIVCTPSTLTFTAKSQTGVATPIDYAGRWIISYSTDGSSYTELYKSATNEASKTITVGTTYKTIKCQMYLAGGTTTLLDEQIIPIVSDGVKGDKGIQGDRGAGINSVTVTYGTSTSASTQPTSWQSTLPTVAEGSYLWTRTVTDYTDDAIADTVTLTYAKQGAKGATGTAGTSVTVSSIQYQSGTSATTAPTGTWSDTVVSVAAGSYLWTKTTFSDGKTAYGVAKQGSDGTSAVTFQLYAPNGYVLSNSLESVTLKGFAYDGVTEITSAAYVWSYQEGDAWVTVTGATTNSLTLTKADVEKSKTYRCAMTYKNKTYYSTATVQDKTDVYDVMICVSDNADPLTGVYYWVVYALLYSDQGEVDALLGPISANAPTSPVSGDYWYAIDSTSKTVTLKQYNGTAWVVSTAEQAYHYDWRQIVNGAQQSIGNTDKVKIISCDSFVSNATFQCIVSDSAGEKLARCSIALTDTSDPIVSATAPTGVKDGQLWMQSLTDGTYVLNIWDAASSSWKKLNADSRNVVHTTQPSQYKVGDLWVVEKDGLISKYGKGTLLQARATSNTFDAAHWESSLKYEDDIDSLKKLMGTYSQYMSADAEGLHMRAKDASGNISPFEALFTNTKLSFRYKQIEVASMSDEKLNIPQAKMDYAEVTTQLKIQTFAWTPESNGSLSLIVNY